MHPTEPPADALIRTAYAREAGDAPILYGGMSLADLAHVVELVETGIVPREAGGELLAALLDLHPAPPLDFALDPARGDLYSNREAYLKMLTPAVGWLSAGRARREATTIAYRIAVRDRLLRLVAALAECADAALDLAESHKATLFPDYTYLQPAQPTTFGHYLLTFVYPLLRDLDRLRAAFARTNLSPAGSGSVNGSRLPLDRARLAERLGFDGVIPHTRDAMWPADEPIEIAALITAALITLDRLAEDLQIFSTAEFGLVELAEALDPVRIVAARTGLGGAAEPPMAQMIADCRAALTDHTNWSEAAQARLSAAESLLLMTATALRVAPSPQPETEQPQERGEPHEPGSWEELFDDLPQPPNRRQWRLPIE